MFTHFFVRVFLVPSIPFGCISSTVYFRNKSIQSGKPAARPAGNSRPAGSATQRRGGAASNRAGTGAAAARSAGGQSSNILQFYTDDSPGLQIGPTTVLIGSLSFVGIVVLLHIWGKFRM